MLLILGALALVIACGFFVAAEFSFVTVDRATVERAAEAGDNRAKGVLGGLRTLSTQLSGAQVGITLTNLSIGFLAEPSIAELVDGPLESAGVPGVNGIALAIALILANGVTMVFGELVPKNLAIAHPLGTAKAVQGFQRGWTRATALIIRWFNGTANAILRRFGVETQEELASARSAEELTSLVGRSAEQGTLEVGTATLLQRSLALAERRAHDVMTPRGRMTTVQTDAPVMAVIRAARESGHSRFPVLAEADEFAGIVHLKQAVAIPRDRREEVAVRDVMVEPLLVPESLELDALLDTLRRGGLQMALVVDEFGTVSGVVTLEDLVEEIVGEVRDEHDVGEDHARRERNGAWELPGLMRPDEVQRLTGVALPEDEEYDTVAGLLGERLGRIPAPGDTLELEADDVEGVPQSVRISVLEMDGLRVDKVRLQHEPRPADGEGEDDA